MKFVSRQTGLSMHTIRVWEKRYGAVRPARAANNHRLYTEEDVERLRLLREATVAGHSISQIARTPLPQLERLVREAGAPLPTPRVAQRDEIAQGLIESALTAIAAFDSFAFTKILERGAIELGSPAILQEFIAPLAERVGHFWRNGELRIAHEHFASHRLAEFLGNFARPYAENATAPHLVLATPSGQLHELGALIVAAAARSHGWRTTYLGAALPVEEVAGALQKMRPRAVGLSIVFPPDDAALRRDLRNLKAVLPRGCALLVGGRSAGDYAKVLGEIKAILIERLTDLYPVLDSLQRSRTDAAKSARAK